MFEKPLAERMERQLREFESGRDEASQEIQAIRDELLKLIKDFFDKLVKDISPQVEETDTIIESCIIEFKKLDNRRRELNSIREKLVPVFEIFGKSEFIKK